MPPEDKKLTTDNQQQNQEPSLKQIRTFQGDVAEALKRQQESLVSIQRTEQMRRGTAPITDTASINARRKDIFFLVLGSLFLFALGTVGTWFAYNEFSRKTSTPTITAPANRFISSNAENDLDLSTVTSRESLINALTLSTENIPPRELHHFILKKKSPLGLDYVLPTEEFLKILESHAPSALVRAFDPLFMFGSFGESTFLIIKLASFENAFAGMLSWERDLGRDLGPIFFTAPLFRNDSGALVFIDTVDRNKDIRELKIGAQTALLYSFFDNNMLIITDNIETLRTLVDRLTREKLSR